MISNKEMQWGTIWAYDGAGWVLDLTDHHYLSMGFFTGALFLIAGTFFKPKRKNV